MKTLNELHEAVAKAIDNGCTSQDVADELRRRHYMVGRPSRGGVTMTSDEVARVKNRLLPMLKQRQSDETARQAHRDYDSGKLRFPERSHPTGQLAQAKLKRIESNNRLKRDALVARAMATLGKFQLTPSAVPMARATSSENERNKIAALECYARGPQGLGW